MEITREAIEQAVESYRQEILERAGEFSGRQQRRRAHVCSAEPGQCQIKPGRLCQ